MALPYSLAEAVTGLTVIKPATGFVIAINVVVSGAAVGTIYDASAVSGSTVLGPTAFTFSSTLGLVANIPTPPGFYCPTGITVLPGAGSTINVMYQ